MKRNNIQHISSSKRPWRMGWGYKDGKLTAFGDRDIVVIRGWPSPMAWRRTRTKPWQPTRKHGDDTFFAVLKKANVLPGYIEIDPELPAAKVKPGEKLPFTDYFNLHVIPREREVAHKFLINTPDAVLQELSRHTNRHWHLYCLFARCPESVELAKNHPVLAYTLASCWVFHKPAPTKPMRAIRSLIRKPVPAIWQWLGFPVDPISIGMYESLEPRGLTIKRLLAYRKAMSNSVTQRFLFDLGSLEWDSLELAITPWMARMITGDLVRDLAQPQAWDLNWAEQVKEALIFLRMIEKEYEIQPLPSFGGVAQVLESRVHFETMLQSDFLMRRQP